MGDAVSRSLISFAADLSRLEADLRSIGDSAPLAIMRGLNRGSSAGRTAIMAEVSRDMALGKRFLSKEIKVYPATRLNPVAAIEIAGRRVPLIGFGARGPEPSRGRGRGVRAKLPPPGAGRYPHAFIATMRSGHRGVFERIAKKRLPIRELLGPSVPHVFQKYLPVFEKAALETFQKTVEHEISFRRERAPTTTA